MFTTKPYLDKDCYDISIQKGLVRDEEYLQQQESCKHRIIFMHANETWFSVSCIVRRNKSSKNHIIIISDLISAKDTLVPPYGKETLKTIEIGYGVLILHH